MGKNKSRRPSKKQIIMDTVIAMNSHVMALSDILASAEDRRVKKFCFDSSEFGGKLSSLLMLRAVQGDDFYFLVSLCNSLCTLWDVLAEPNEEALNWMREEYDNYLDTLQDHVSPSEIERLRKEFESIDGDYIEMEYSLLNSLAFGLGLLNFDQDNIIDGGSYCPHCIASKMRLDLIDKIPNLFGSHIQCLKFANSMEAISNHPHTPSGKRDSFAARAADFRSFADVNQEDILNYDEIVMGIATDYACAMVECAAFVRCGFFDLHELAMLSGFDIEELRSLSESDGVANYIKAVGKI